MSRYELRTSHFRSSLVRKKTIMGVDDILFTIELIAGLMLIVVGFYWWFLAVLPVHRLCVYFTKIDPFAIESYLKYMREVDVYEPWITQPAADKRPEGFGRGWLI